MKGTIREYAIAGSDAGPYGITTGKDGALWYTEQKGNRIGRITGKGEMKSFPIPTPDAGAMTIVSDRIKSVELLQKELLRSMKYRQRMQSLMALRFVPKEMFGSPKSVIRLLVYYFRNKFDGEQATVVVCFSYL